MKKSLQLLGVIFFTILLRKNYSYYIFDRKATQVRSNGKNAILYIWYDNECGYSQQVMRLAKYVAGVRRFTYH